MIERLRPFGLLALLSFLTVVGGVSGSLADSAGPTLSPGRQFSEQTGEALYTNLCQACHMSDGKGAVGAGHYPSLVRNEALKANGYAVSLILRGHKAMPPFGRMLSDDQVAAVVNYIRTHFDNDYTDAVTAQDVKDAR
jgi:mono/diheme cytochrome c family protein